MPADPELLNAFSGSARDFLAREHNSDGTHSAAPYDAKFGWLGSTLKRTLVAASESFGIAVLSDSTANSQRSGPNAGDWPYELAVKFAAAYPAWTVRWYIWDDASQDYLAPVTVQTGTAGGRFVRFPGTGFAYQLPSGVVATPPTDLDVAVLASLDDWTPAANQTLVAHDGGAGSRGWWLTVAAATGRLNLTWSNDGTTLITVASSVSPTVTDGASLWIRATLDVDDGAGNRVIKFYTSPDGATWTQLGTTTTTVGVTTLFNPPNLVYNLGSRQGGSAELITGNIYEVRVRGGTVAGATTATGVNALNSATINCGATAQFPSSGIATLAGASFTYTGVTGTSFTGCSNHAATTGGEAITGPPGPVILPIFADQWEPVSSTSPNGATGAPILNIIASAQLGQGLTYLSHSTRLPLLLPDYSLKAVFLATSHNESTGNTDSVWTAAWLAWITAVKARAYEAVPVVMTENPQVTGSSSTVPLQRAHTIRRNKLLALAGQVGLPALDSWQAFLDTGNAAQYIQTDGVHASTIKTFGASGGPSVTGGTIAGSQLWANYVYAAAGF